MKKVMRYEDNRDYWDRRWSESGRDPRRFSDLSIYPIRYAEMVMTDPAARTLEIGAGLGRVLKHYHYQSFDISGIERSEIAVDQMRAEDPSLSVTSADVCDLPFADESFDVVLAFGVYHNLEHGLETALLETARCLRTGGRFCISMRPNNAEMRLNEFYWNWKRRGAKNGGKRFHKWLVGQREFARQLADVGLITESVHRARNMSLLYRLAMLRQRTSDESSRRSGGYRLNRGGQLLDRALTGLFPGQFCNVLVYIGRKTRVSAFRRAA